MIRKRIVIDIPERATRRKPGRPRSEAAHKAILAAVVAEVRAVGYDAVTIEAVAARAGVGKSTVYRRWKSKELLVADAVAAIARRTRAPDTGSTRGDLAAALTDNLRMYLDPATTELLSGLIAAMARNAGVAEAMRTGLVAARRNAMRDVLIRGRARGELRADFDLDLALDMLSGPLLYRSLITGGRVDLRFIHGVTDAALRAFAP